MLKRSSSAVATSREATGRHSNEFILIGCHCWLPSIAGAADERRTKNKSMAEQLTLKRASASRPSGEWNADDFDVLVDGAVVGRVMKVHAAPAGSPWMWTLAFGHHEDRTPTRLRAEREVAMAAFAKNWRWS